jgi:hypothetical protein
MCTSRPQQSHRKQTFQMRLTQGERNEISAGAESLGLTDSAFVLAACKLFRAELRQRGVLVLEPAEEGQSRH